MTACSFLNFLRASFLRMAMKEAGPRLTAHAVWAGIHTPFILPLCRLPRLTPYTGKRELSELFLQAVHFCFQIRLTLLNEALNQPLTNAAKHCFETNARV